MLLSLINAAGVFGRWVPGFYADRLGRFNMLILTVLGCLLSILCLWLPTKSSEPMMVVFALVFGFFGGSNVSLAPVCIGQLCKVESFGRYYSTAYILVSISMFTGTALGGKFIEVCLGEYHGVIAFAAASYLASFICLVMAKTLSCGKSNIWSKF
ncbi:hypothetical protein N7519_004643 [Penicillium mononematosum]|uniref:uncharacterized protein n=1 Tax=Penicillium mononematosum TaxID=268346 RepID=UPI002547F0AE|nr:uncharacterized protein N7519_004643 [Penicillium mononematosum]KAJ6189735.1 hypothetical protein N7519_004643 [Penicillium mononematosum]